MSRPVEHLGWVVAVELLYKLEHLPGVVAIPFYRWRKAAERQCIRRTGRNIYGSSMVLS